MMRNEGFVTVKEAARILDVAPNTVRAWGAAGKICEYRHPANQYRMYKLEELKDLLTLASRPVSKSPKLSNRKPK